MGSFNRFLTDHDCPRCGSRVTFAYQFKFGDKHQHDYQPGDVLRWGGNDEGDPGQPLVLAECTPEECPACGYDPDSSAFRLLIENGRLMSVAGPLELDDPVFGSMLSEPDTRAVLRARRQQLGLWRASFPRRSRSSGQQAYSNFGETFIVLRNGNSALLNPVCAGLSWSGPAFVWVLGTTRTEGLTRLLAPMTLLYSGRGHEAPVV